MNEKQYHFIEVMVCPGGCVNGGGQPIVDYNKVDVEDFVYKFNSSVKFGKRDVAIFCTFISCGKHISDKFQRIIH